MGVTYLQHRLVTGLHCNRCLPMKRKVNDKISLVPNKVETLKIMFGVICVVYLYLILMLLAGAIETAGDNISVTRFHCTYSIGLNKAYNDRRSYLNSAFIILLMIMYAQRRNTIFHWIRKYACPHGYLTAKCSGAQYLCNMLTVWTTMLNLFLLVICNTSIMNPRDQTPILR